MHIPRNAAHSEAVSESIRQSAVALNATFTRPLQDEEQTLADKLGRIYQATNLSREALVQLWQVYVRDVMHSNELDIGPNETMFLAFLLGVKLVVRRRSGDRFDPQKAEDRGEKAVLRLQERLSVEGG